jgi:hypothetical protein
MAGHLTQVISATEYAILSEAAFIPANDPGIQAPHPANFTAAQIIAADKSHAKYCDGFSNHYKTGVALQSQLLMAVFKSTMHLSTN